MRFTKDCTRIFKTAAVIAACLLFSACGAAEVLQPQGTDIVQYTLPPVEEQPIPVKGGELKFPIPNNPPTLNPLKIKNLEMYNLFSLIYEQPVRIGKDGTAGPELAETWSVDSSGTKWTFRLRKGVSWQGGNGEFTSDDIIYTIGLIKSYTKDDSVYAQYNSSIKDYSAPDEYTVEITLSQPGNAAVYFMTFPVMCKAYCSGKELDELHPTGTGPYIADEYDKDKQMSLKANDLWWKQAPYIQSLTALCYSDHDMELAAFSGDLIDFMTTSALTVDTYKKYGIKNYSDYLTRFYDCLVPNASSGFFSDVNMRRALALSLDKREIISKALLGHAVAADYPIAPDSYLSGESAGINEYNPQKAAALFEQAGWKDRNKDGVLEKVDGTQVTNLNIKLLIPLNKENTYRRDAAENVRIQLMQCGIQVEVVEEEFDAYKLSLQNGSFELAFCSFFIDQNPDVSFMIGTGGSANYGAFSDERMDGLLSKCKSALTEEEMKNAYYEMEREFMDKLPQISLCFKTNALLYDASINISDSISDMDIYTTIPQWYLYVKEPGTE